MEDTILAAPVAPPEAADSAPVHATVAVDGPKAAGVALHALDTGRVLFIQRALIDGEPNGGCWEIPGGGIDDGETPWDAAQREYAEETGHHLPPGELTGTWMSPNGVYQGHVFATPEEFPLDQTDPMSREVVDPDNPGGQNYTESQAWMDPNHLDRGPKLLRQEMRDYTPWAMLKDPYKYASSVTAAGDIEGDSMAASPDKIVVDVVPRLDWSQLFEEYDPQTTIEEIMASAAGGSHEGMVKLSTGWAYPINNKNDLDNARHAFGRSKPQDREKLRRHIVSKAHQLGVKLDDKWEGSMAASAEEIFESLVASLAQPASALLPETPLEGPTPYTVNDDGTADGHLALWASCHIGYPGCVKPPQEDSFDFYNLGDAVTADGRHVPVGKITVGTGHAGADLSWRTAAAHYDNSGTVVAAAHAVPDRWGIRLPSVLTADITGPQIDELRRSPLSGDWRRINGKLRLVAALGVNVPGYPVPRALVAAGEVQSMFVGFDPEDAGRLIVEADSLAASIGLDLGSRFEDLRRTVEA